MSAHEAKKYLAYKLKAKNEHSIHSPFVFTLYTEVIKNREKYYAYDEIGRLRKKLLHNEEVIEVTDLGAGSKKLKKKRSIAEIAKVSMIPQKYGELLFRLTNYFQPKNILELGTSLGVSALYMHKAAPKAKLISVEGCSETNAFARNLFASNGVPPAKGEDHASAKRKNGHGGVELVCGSFDEYLPEIALTQKFDLIYIDGNHTYEATIRYFHNLLEHVNNNSVMIFDDIYWSAGMTKAWEEIKAHPSVRLAIDLFKVGIIFFRKENKQKENFILRY